MNRDSIGYVDGMNLYAYVDSNPTSYVDPTGKWKSGEHRRLTQRALERFAAWRRQLKGKGKITTPPPSAACRGYLWRKLQNANLSQGKGNAFKENSRHYNRGLKEGVGAAKRKFQAYIAKEIRWFSSELSNISGKCDTNAEKESCNDAVWALAAR